MICSGILMKNEKERMLPAAAAHGSSLPDTGMKFSVSPAAAAHRSRSPATEMESSVSPAARQPTARSRRTRRWTWTAGRGNGVDDVAGCGSPRLEHVGRGDGRLKHAGRGGDHQAEQHLGEPHSRRGNRIHGARLGLNGSRSFSPGSSSGTLERAGSVSLHEAPTPGACGHTPF